MHMSTSRTRERLIEVLTGLHKFGSDAKATAAFREAFADYGSGAPDSVASASQISVATRKDPINGVPIRGLRLRSRSWLLRDVVWTLESCPIPSEVRKDFPGITREEWAAVGRVISMVISLFTEVDALAVPVPLAPAPRSRRRSNRSRPARRGSASSSGGGKQARANPKRNTMKKLPEAESPFVIRTDFSNQGAWDEICAIIRQPVGEEDFLADVEFVDDAAYANASKKQLLKLFPEDSFHSFCIIADQKAMSQPEHPLLIIDVLEKPGREFRAMPSTIQSIENNLSTSNMDFEDFAGEVSKDGVFRGFSDA